MKRWVKYGKDKDVTSYVKSIFGDGLVESAFISDKYKKHVDNDYKEIVNFSDKEINLTDSVILVVKFVNGKVLNIWASEWGGVRECEPESFIKRDDLDWIKAV